MTNLEFSNNFDILVNSYATLTPEGVLDPIAFDEYEKSVFLTKALELIVLEYYTGKNTFRDSFEKSEEIRRSLDTLVRTSKCTEIDNITGDNIDPPKNSYSKIFKLKVGDKELHVWFITYEGLIVTNEGDSVYIPVIPITQDDYHRTKNNPFRGPNNHRALRLDIENNRVEIITNLNTNNLTYYVRYLTKPTPIILLDLPDGLTIDGEHESMNCTVHPLLHKIILDRAVLLALVSKSIGVKQNNN